LKKRKRKKEMSKRKSLRQLFVPITIELLCYMLAGIIDTLMISSVSDKAVGAVGTANTYLSVFVISFSIISSGVIAVMTQFIGAGQKGVAYQARQVGLVFNAVIGIILSVFLLLFSGNVLRAIGIADDLEKYATTYMMIVGGGCFIMAIIPIFGNYLRAFGHTKEPLYATAIANIINLVLNALFLFVFDMGVAGVAIATLISRIVNAAIVVIIAYVKINHRKFKDRIESSKVLFMILKIGLPAALETACYNVAISMVIHFLNGMDSEGINVTARAYTTQVASFSYCIGAGLAQANSIMTGWFVGSGEYDKCDKQTRKAANIGIIIAIIVDTIFALTAGFFMPFLSDNQEIINLVKTLLFVDILLEVGRVTNLVYGGALKTSGDVYFPLYCAIIVMFTFAVGGSYLLGVRMDMLVIGAYIAMALDEFVRGICVMIRWRTGIWREKSLVKAGKSNIKMKGEMA